MRHFLSRKAALKHLETPCVYHIKKDELYELDEEAFEFLKECRSASSVRDSATDPKRSGVQKYEINSFIKYCLKEGILTEEKVSIKRPALTRSPVPSLRYLELQITDRCNLRCKHCYIRKHSGKELSIRQIRQILTEFEDMQGLRVLITGGEPLLHSRFDEINEMLPEFSLRKILFTNGLLLNRRILKNLNVHEIQISIDGLEKAHDFLRGKGTFKKTMDAVRLSIESGFDVSISTMVHPANLKDFNRMEKLLKKTGIKGWTVDIPCVTGRLKDNSEFQIAPEIGGKYLRYGYGEGIHSGAMGFGCGLHLMSIMADGKIAKCTFYSDRAVGGIKDGLRKCWQKIKPVRLDELKCDCEYIESCRGGCRYRAEILGDPHGKDLYRCFLYDIIESDRR